VQHAPELFKVLRVLIDGVDSPARFLLLGSASPNLLRQSSESLAGGLEVIEAGGLHSGGSRRRTVGRAVVAAGSRVPSPPPATPTAASGVANTSAP